MKFGDSLSSWNGQHPTKSLEPVLAHRDPSRARQRQKIGLLFDAGDLVVWDAWHGLDSGKLSS